MCSSFIAVIALVLSRFQAHGTTAVFTKRLSNAESANSKICPDILQKFERGIENINILVNFVQGTDTVLKHSFHMKFSDRREHALGTYFALKWHADKTQDNLIQKQPRDKHGKINLSVHFHKYWLTNQLIIKGAELDLIREIAEFEQVAEIKEEPVANLIQSVDDNISADETTLAPGLVPWNLEQIYLPETLKELHGKNAGGTVVGFIGSANGKHIALQNKFLGEYGWLDPVNGSLTPTETGNGQGTHAVAIAVGGKGIGIAPGARWAACKACSQNTCPYHFILHCAQFWACPTLSNGTNMDCTKAPHVLLNSWAGDKNEYGDIIKGWHAFGIIPIFPLATCGSGSVMHPVNDSRIIAMASRDDAKEENSKVMVTTPKYNRNVIATKSNLITPGNRILSAEFNSKTGYKLMSGANQASAHAAGLIALLFTRESELSFDKAKRILEQASDQSVCVKRCGCRNLNALNALKVQRALRWS